MTMDRETLKSLASNLVDPTQLRSFGQSLGERVGFYQPPTSLGRDLALLAAGLGIGALVMYLLDPDEGRHRRGQAREQVSNLASTAERAIGERAKNLTNRAREAVGGTTRQAHTPA
jgi:hypothetical protein